MQQLFIHFRIVLNYPCNFNYDTQANISSSFYAFEYEFTVVYEVCVHGSIPIIQCELFNYMISNPYQDNVNSSKCHYFLILEDTQLI